MSDEQKAKLIELVEAIVAEDVAAVPKGGASEAEIQARIDAAVQAEQDRILAGVLAALSAVIKPAASI